MNSQRVDDTLSTVEKVNGNYGNGVYRASELTDVIGRPQKLYTSRENGKIAAPRNR